MHATNEKQSGTPSNGPDDHTSELLSSIRDFCRTRVNFRLQNERRCFQPHAVLEFGRLGTFGLQIPKEYGGLNLSLTDSLRILEQVGGIDLSLGLFVGQMGLGLQPILRFGSKSLKEEFLPRIATGQALTSYALTEAEAGSNFHGIQGTIRRTSGNTFLLNATKMWIGSGGWADAICVFAHNVDGRGIRSGLTGCVVRPANKGFSIGAECKTMGLRGTVQNRLHFSNVKVTQDDLLGGPGKGFIVANNAMQFARLGIGAITLGAMKRCLLLAHRYA